MSDVEVVTQGPCIACLYEDELDSRGFCLSCAPTDPEFSNVLMRLLNKSAPLQLKEVDSTSEDN